MVLAGLERVDSGTVRIAGELLNGKSEDQIASFRGHVIVCGWGRVGKAIARELAIAEKPVVIIDSDPARLSSVRGCPYIEGDASDDDVLREAGIERASALVAAVATDAGNLVITLSGRALQPDLFIVARAREETSAAKLERAGANRVVNPQEIGGARMAAFLVQPHVTEFLDVVMHDREMALRLEELEIAADSPLANITVGQAHVRDQTGALILAIRDPDGGFITSPGASTAMEPGHVLMPFISKAAWSAAARCTSSTRQSVARQSSDFTRELAGRCCRKASLSVCAALPLQSLSTGSAAKAVSTRVRD